MEKHKAVVLSIEDEFSDFHADFLTIRRCEPALLRLLTELAGKWYPVEALLPETDEMRQRLSELQQKAGDNRLFVSWLPYPPAFDDRVLVLFFVENFDWDAIAIYNRARLVEKLQNGHTPEE